MHVPARDRVLKFIAATITTFICGLLFLLTFITPAFSIEIEDWVVVGNYPLRVRWNEAIVHNGHIYVVGGKLEDDTPTNAVNSAPVNPDGSLGAWDARSSLIGPRYLHAAAADATHLYVSGGWNSAASDANKAYADLWRAPFAENGGLGEWEAIRGLPKAIRIHESVIVNGYLYIIGGYNEVDKTLDTVYFAKIEEDSELKLGAWQEANRLPSPVRGHSAVVFDDFLYVTGGFDDTKIAESTVYMAQFQADGKLSAWVERTDLDRPTNYHKALIHNDRLVIIGGTNRDENNAPAFDFVYSSAIAADGMLDTEWRPEPKLLQGLSRFAAVTTVREEHQYIYTIGGDILDGKTSAGAISEVSLSAPLGPPPTPPGLNLFLANDPKGWPLPGEEITYTITYENPGYAAITGVELYSGIPENTELVEGSIVAGDSNALSFTGFQPGDQINWSFDEIGPGENGSVSYRVLRSLRPSSSSTLAEISKEGPAAVDPGDLITYTLTITSTVPQDIPDLEVEDTLPRRAHYVSGGALGDDGKVRWTVPTLTGYGTTTVSFVVTATQSLINSDYRALFASFEPAVGRNIVITRVGDTPLPPEGDGTVITNTGATATWFYAGEEGNSASNAMNNPSFSIYMPVINR